IISKNKSFVLKKFKIFWTVLAPFYHIISWLIRPNTTLRHGLSGVPLPLHSLARTAAPPLQSRVGRLHSKNPSMDFLNDCRSRMLLHALTRHPWLGIPWRGRKNPAREKSLPSPVEPRLVSLSNHGW
ncbi:MAG: hypothetical protein IJM03_08485, partial [Treponema sp.]|nr:hypothetical protein [Treponema sp.]